MDYMQDIKGKISIHSIRHAEDDDTVKSQFTYYRGTLKRITFDRGTITIFDVLVVFDNDRDMDHIHLFQIKGNDAVELILNTWEKSFIGDKTSLVKKGKQKIMTDDRFMVRIDIEDQ